MICRKNMTIFGIIVLKENLIANPSTIKKIKIKTRSYSDEATDFHERKVPEAGSNYICWSVTFIDVLKNSENYYYY